VVNCFCLSSSFCFERPHSRDVSDLFVVSLWKTSCSTRQICLLCRFERPHAQHARFVCCVALKDLMFNTPDLFVVLLWKTSRSTHQICLSPILVRVNNRFIWFFLLLRICKIQKNQCLKIVLRNEALCLFETFLTVIDWLFEWFCCWLRLDLSIVGVYYKAKVIAGWFDFVHARLHIRLWAYR
jgi:hypothetical protein